MAIRYRVKEIAEEQGMNRSQLSRRADLSLPTVNDIWESRQDVRVSTLYAIAKVLGVKLVDLLEETEESGLFPDILENKINALDRVAA